MTIVKICKNESDKDILAWKYPNDELNTLTQLVVSESEEAVLFKDGKALDVFQSGRYTLDTANIPLLNKILNLPFGGKSPFLAQVWFVNKLYTLDIKWGTRTPIQIQDPKYAVLLQVRAFGQFGIRIDDSKRFLTKLVGKVSEFNTDDIRNYFRGLYLTKVKDSISSYLVKKQISITEINAYIDELSEYVEDRMKPVFEEYGIKLVNFFVNDVSVSEDDPTIEKLRDALAKKAEMDIVGYNYQQERSFNVMDKYSSNEGKQNNIANMGIDLAIGAAVGNSIGSNVGNVVNRMVVDNKTSLFCSKCGTRNLLDSRFCSKCGERLINACPSCGVELQSNDFKYCPNCGKKLK